MINRFIFGQGVVIYYIPDGFSLYSSFDIKSSCSSLVSLLDLFTFSVFVFDEDNSYLTAGNSKHVLIPTIAICNPARKMNELFLGMLLAYAILKRNKILLVD